MGDERRAWTDEAVRRIEADFNRSADTHLIRVELPRFPGITLYMKDESVHPTGSLKHRLARSLILYGLCNNRIGPDTLLVDATSGSTAGSEAYFARLIGLKFVAVIPRSTSPAKIEAIRFHGGDVHMVDSASEMYVAAERLAREAGGLFLDQFTYAERATDWRGNNNIAQSIFQQMAREDHPVPTWLVCGAGTGGTSATLGRFIRYGRHPTRLCVADPEGSVFHRHFADRSVMAPPAGMPCQIEGIGRPRVEPSFLPDVIDRMIAVPDGASIGAMRAIADTIGRPVGGSTGTNIHACLELAQEMAAQGREGSIVTILCDSGLRYAQTYYDDGWLEAQGIDWRGYEARAADLLRTI
ncbi:PLP-dependent cysteine synthase family protein [Novosphingobium sp. CECT 9465]|uniref:PLP-dependent cysteine synthase family protein n=1 Tax=Novosphingobium sp. CECT 9465 TaxID=2829794 RepID=UPI001E58A607|nr:PLP-dependent cysteine synthase family protein [Novosphingobium sp. CECT 9465]CAH0495862.1 N-(2-amino-2-carboxyethyl)-L-glutamate synthase [Novosphingobium sp. CECT 9465]